MAWRADADADRHIRTGSIPAGAATVCAFIYQSVDRNAFSCPLIVDDNTTGGSGTAEQFYIETLSDGVSLQVFWRNSAGTSGNTSTIAVVQPATWYFVAMRRSGTTITGYVRKVGSAQWSKQSTTTSGTLAPTHFRVGGCDPVFTSEFWNGRIAGVRLWNVAITESELLRESLQLAPVSRRHNLVLWWQENTAVDLSGRGRHPTTKGTATLEPGPPVPLFRNQPVILDHVKSSSAAALAGDAQAQASATGALTTEIPLAGAALVVSTATGALTTQIPLAGSVAVVATMSGELLTEIRLSGAAIAEALAQAGLTTEISLAGAAAAVATMQGELTTQIRLQGAAIAEVTASGDLTVQSGLAGAAQAQATASGALTTQIPLAGDAVAVAGMQGALTTAIALAGSAQAVAEALGALSTQIPLAGVAASVTTGEGALTTEIRLTAAAAAQAIAAGGITTLIRLSGAALVDVVASGSLGEPVPPAVDPRFHARARADRFEVAANDERFQAQFPRPRFRVSA